MGQLSAYRFPESSGWEKIWSWTLETPTSLTNGTFYIDNVPPSVWDYDVIMLNISNIIPTKFNNNYSWTRFYLQGADDSGSTGDNGYLFYGGVNINSYVNISRRSGGGTAIIVNLQSEYSSVLNFGYFTRDDYMNQRLKKGIYPKIKFETEYGTSVIAFDSGMKFDFYGMNLPK